MIRTEEQRRQMRTPAYRAALGRCRASKDGPGVWVAFHDGARVRGYGSTAGKARTDCALRVAAIGWEA